MSQYTVKYTAGSVVYVVSRAKQGILEKVSIKKYRLVVNRVFGIGAVIYTDSFNSLWNEEELCPESTAVQLSIDYYEQLLADLAALASNGGARGSSTATAVGAMA